jgi:hypothetical protein
MDVERGKREGRGLGGVWGGASFVHKLNSDRHNPQATHKKIRVERAQSPESAKTPHLSLEQVSEGWILLTTLMVGSRATIGLDHQ